MFYVGQIVTVVANHTNHCFKIGEVVELTEMVKYQEDAIKFRWRGNKKPRGWLSAECISHVTEEINIRELL